MTWSRTHGERIGAHARGRPGRAGKGDQTWVRSKRLYTADQEQFEDEDVHQHPPERPELELTRLNISRLGDIHSGRWPETVVEARGCPAELAVLVPVEKVNGDSELDSGREMGVALEPRRCSRCGQAERHERHVHVAAGVVGSLVARLVDGSLNCRTRPVDARWRPCRLRRPAKRAPTGRWKSRGRTLSLGPASRPRDSHGSTAHRCRGSSITGTRSGDGARNGRPRREPAPSATTGAVGAEDEDHEGVFRNRNTP